MYDWSTEFLAKNKDAFAFQLLLKGCTIEAKYWTVKVGRCDCFSCCWKDVRLKRRDQAQDRREHRSFSCCWKDVRLKLKSWISLRMVSAVSVVVERMYDWNPTVAVFLWTERSFSCCWKDVRLKLNNFAPSDLHPEFQLLLKGCTIEANLTFVQV